MLTSIHLYNDTLCMTREVDDVAVNLNLPAKMRFFHPEAMTQVPPQFALCFRLDGSHPPCELTLWWYLSTITPGPHSRLVLS